MRPFLQRQQSKTRKRNMHGYMLFVLFGIAMQCCSQTNTYKVIQQNDSAKGITKILMAAYGNVEDRSFTESLSGYISKSLHRKKIEWTYQYLGKDAAGALNDLVKYKNNYDAVFLFSPEDLTQMLNVKANKTTIHGGSDPGNTGQTDFSQRTVRLRYTSSYTLSLLENRNADSLIMKASLEINFDLATNTVYSDISKKIIESLQDGKIFIKKE